MATEYFILREDCSQIIDILQEIGGMEEYISSFEVQFHYDLNCNDIKNKLDKTKNHVIFKSSGGDRSGHFHFFNKFLNKCEDSYKLGWQVAGRNGFCQTFALMGALGMHEVFKLKSKNKCSEIACQYLIDNAIKNPKNFKKYWRKLCKAKDYKNIENLTPKEIEEDIHKSRETSLFNKLVQDEVVYL